MERLKKILTRVLLVFVLISIGFALGKHSVKSDAPPLSFSGAKGHQVVVYYLHSTFRCVTCNSIEEMTRELLNNSYRSEMDAGTIRWIEADFQENETLATDFEVAASCVVVANMVDGRISDYKRLDKVWTLMDDPETFNAYISNAIDGYLRPSGGDL